jgi:hypothetical protein
MTAAGAPWTWCQWHYALLRGAATVVIGVLPKGTTVVWAQATRALTAVCDHLLPTDVMADQRVGYIRSASACAFSEDACRLPEQSGSRGVAVERLRTRLSGHRVVPGTISAP